MSVDYDIKLEDMPSWDAVVACEEASHDEPPPAEWVVTTLCCGRTRCVCDPCVQISRVAFDGAAWAKCLCGFMVEQPTFEDFYKIRRL